MDLSVVLPALDEGESLRSLLPALKKALAELGVSYEVIVVEGGSTDDTVTAAGGYGAQVVVQKRKGFGQALREGFEAARGEWTLVMDADGSHPPADLKRLWELREKFELIAASRFCAGGSAEMPGWRYWGSRLMNVFTSVACGLPLSDASSGYRLYRTKLVKGLDLRQRDFSAQQEILAHVLARGGRAAEIPFHYAPRVGGESKARPLKWLGSYARMVLRVRALLAK